VVPLQNFFKTLKAKPLTITDYREDYLHQTFLRDRDVAFKDMRDRIIYDLPPHFEGAVMLKTNYDYNQPAISFTQNRKTDLYIAVSDSKPSPLDENFIVSRNKKKTKIKLSVLKINLEDKQE